MLQSSKLAVSVALWKEGDLTDSGSSQAKSIFKLAESSAAIRGWLEMDLAGLELKLQEVHFAVMFSEAEAQRRLRRTWLQSAPSAVSTQCQQGDCQVHQAELASWHWRRVSEDALPPQCDLTLVRWALYSHCQTIILKKRGLLSHTTLLFGNFEKMQGYLWQIQWYLVQKQW